MCRAVPSHTNCSWTNITAPRAVRAAPRAPTCSAGATGRGGCLHSPSGLRILSHGASQAYRLTMPSCVRGRRGKCRQVVLATDVPEDDRQKGQNAQWHTGHRPYPPQPRRHPPALGWALLEPRVSTPGDGKPQGSDPGLSGLRTACLGRSLAAALSVGRRTQRNGDPATQRRPLALLPAGRQTLSARALGG